METIIRIDHAKEDLNLLFLNKYKFKPDSTNNIKPCVFINDDYYRTKTGSKKLSFDGVEFHTLLILPNKSSYKDNIDLYKELDYDRILFYDIKNTGTEDESYNIYFEKGNFIIVYSISSTNTDKNEINIFKKDKFCQEQPPLVTITKKPNSWHSWYFYIDIKSSTMSIGVTEEHTSIICEEENKICFKEIQ